MNPIAVCVGEWGRSQGPAAAVMEIEQTSYRLWTEAYRCTVGSAELILVTAIGPRILSLRLNAGANVLHEDPTGFGVGEWRLYGGHRFATAPESEASYTPDNERCAVTTEDGRLTVTQRPDPAGLSRTLHLSGIDSSGFEIRHVLRNTGAASWQGAPWAITCVDPVGRIVVPWRSPQDCASGPPVRYWSQPGETYADATSRQWQPGADCFVIDPTGQKGKMGLFSDRGWVALLRSDATFVIRSHNPVAGARYPDGGCNVEVYTCAQYLELETLGPLTTLGPGQELVHEERWQLASRTFTPSEWALIDGLDRPLLADHAGAPI